MNSCSRVLILIPGRLRPVVEKESARGSPAERDRTTQKLEGRDDPLTFRPDTSRLVYWFGTRFQTSWEHRNETITSLESTATWIESRERGSCKFNDASKPMGDELTWLPKEGGGHGFMVFLLKIYPPHTQITV